MLNIYRQYIKGVGMKNPRFLYQDSSTELEGKTRWEDGKQHRFGKSVINKRYSKKTPLFEKDLVSSSSRRISYKKNKIQHKTTMTRNRNRNRKGGRKT